jgi:hypothetical protein
MAITPASINRTFPVPPTGFQEVAGEDITQLFASVNSLLSTVNGQSINNQLLITANGAIAPNTAATYTITKAGVAVMTLAAPTVGTSDGVRIAIISNTAFSHTLTATGLLQTGSANVNVATFAAFAGASLTLQAFQGKWNVIASTGLTFS